MRLKTRVNLNEAQEKTYSVLAQNGFEPMEAGSFPFLYAYRADNQLHELSATTCAIWAFAYRAIYKMIHSCLTSVWFYRDGKVFFYVHRPQSSEYSLQEIVDTLYRLAIESGLDSLQLWPVEERFLDDYKAVEGYDTEFENNENMSEYKYRILDIVKLEGGANQNKRTILKKYFDRANIISLKKSNFDICLDIEEEWCKTEDCDSCYFYGSGCAKDSLFQMLTIFDDNIHRGLLGFIDGKPVAYSIWDKIKPGYYVTYFAKSIVKNFTTYLYYVMAKDHMQDGIFLNNGPDMGKEGLRNFKRHLSTYELCGKYLCTFRKQDVQC
ncbi:MAG: DUF2156 domain-containing protein [Treponema sp.]|jgi:hypothetical protein|nr:DUF2156 domain-containing protein [Treponema sp.]